MNKEDGIDLIGGNYLKHGHEVKNRESLYQAVNYVNRIKFKINTDLLDYLNGKGSFLLNEPIPTDKSEVEAYKSNELQTKITLKIAQTYRDIDFYLNIHTD
jgi:hypothetical protein